MYQKIIDDLKSQREEAFANYDDETVAKLQTHIDYLETSAPKFLNIKKTINPDTARVLEYVDKKPCVAALVCTHDMSKVLLVRQYRAGCKNRIHEVVAGVIEDDQDELDALFAELRQEVGISKTDIAGIDNLGSFYSSVGWTNEIAHLFIVRLKPHFEQLEQQLDEEECLSYIWVNVKDLQNIHKNNPLPIKTAMLVDKFLSMKGN